MFSAITLECLNRFWIFKRQFHLIFNRQSVGLRIFLFTCKTKKVAKCKQMIVLSIIWHDVTSAATWPNSSNPENQSIGTPRSGALRSGAESNFAGAHPERNSQFIVGAQCGAQLRKLQERNLERNYKICAPNQVKNRYK